MVKTSFFHVFQREEAMKLVRDAIAAGILNDLVSLNAFWDSKSKMLFGRSYSGQFCHIL